MLVVVDDCNYYNIVDYDVDYYNVFYEVYQLDNQNAQNDFVDYSSVDMNSLVVGNFVNSFVDIVVDTNNFVDNFVGSCSSNLIVVDIGNHFAIEQKFVVAVEDNHTFDFDIIVIDSIVDKIGGLHIIEMV